jgi:putrescine transport system ATP-binding protein
MSVSARAPGPASPPAAEPAREAADPLLRLDGVSKAFDGVAAVSDVDLALGRGELFALLGASGSGKTTLLRIVAGLERPDRGRVLIGGRDMTDAPPYERPVNTVFQSYALFPHMRVHANIAFGLKQERVRRAEIQRRVAEMLELVQMSEYARRRPHQLSGGQRQRVALARSLVKLPKLLLLDEPLAALDRRLREQTRLELAAIQRRVGIAFVLVTHDQEEAMSLADRLAVMNEGRIVQIGTPREIYERPQTRFVAEFIGQTNLMEGRVASRAGALVTLRAADLGDDLKVYDKDAEPGETLWLAVRPERMAIGDGPDPLANRRTGVVRQVEYLGDSSIVHVETATKQRLRARIPHRGDPSSDPVPGAHVTVSWEPQAGVVLRA